MAKFIIKNMSTEQEKIPDKIQTLVVLLIPWSPTHRLGVFIQTPEDVCAHGCASECDGCLRMRSREHGQSDAHSRVISPFPAKTSTNGRRVLSATFQNWKPRGCLPNIDRQPHSHQLHYHTPLEPFIRAIIWEQFFIETLGLSPEMKNELDPEIRGLVIVTLTNSYNLGVVVAVLSSKLNICQLK